MFQSNKKNNNVNLSENSSKIKYVYKNSSNSSNISNSSNRSNSSYGGYSMSNVFGIILLLVVVLGLIGSSYWLYNYYSQQIFDKPHEVEAMPDIKNATSSFNIGSGTIPNSNYSNEYSISFWINILDYNYNYGKEKVILRRGEAGAGNPEILLAAKTNDLIVRLKLQGDDKTISSFTDIPISLNLNNMNSNTEPHIVDINNTRENFNIISMPESVNFSTNSNYIELNNKIGENKIDYPTIEYSSKTNFNLISGNNISNVSNFSNLGNLVEKFDDNTDAINCIIDILVDICDITTYLQNTTTTNNAINIINLFFDSIIEYINNIHSAIKNESSITDEITLQFKTKMNNITDSINNNILTEKLNKLNVDSEKLNKYKNVSIEYSVLQNTINSKMNEINCPLTFDGTTELDGSLSFLENFIKLLKLTLNNFMNNLITSINKTNTQTSAKCVIDSSINKDPTIGSCEVKMIPLQKWVSVCVSVYNQIIDIYIDGQLSSSCVLKRFPAINTKDVNLSPDGGFSGMISRVKFMNSAMTIQQAKNIYYDGPIVTTTIFSSIPNWVYWSILIIIIISLIYSFLV